MSRYTGVTDEDLREMLDVIGVGSLEDLFADIPESLRLGRELDLPQGQSEQEVYEHLAALAARNRHSGGRGGARRGRRAGRGGRAGGGRGGPGPGRGGQARARARVAEARCSK